ncbi:MAG: hypothetical protein QM770_16390 [Tepidisphaeraceae bacterium]
MSSATPAIDPALLKILRCPLTRSELTLEGDTLVATKGGLRYPIRDGIPVLLVEEAELPEGVNSLDELKSSSVSDLARLACDRRSTRVSWA